MDTFSSAAVRSAAASGALRRAVDGLEAGASDDTSLDRVAETKRTNPGALSRAVANLKEGTASCVDQAIRDELIGLGFPADLGGGLADIAMSDDLPELLKRAREVRRLKAAVKLECDAQLRVLLRVVARQRA